MSHLWGLRKRRGSMEEQKKIILRNWEKISEKCVWELIIDRSSVP